ncbi:DUF6873 family GME fold protein [uncultured Fenollaria sp.]|uniref:DUF6873 family GME fold protein n=1 Tax=uncultured Fenollaria sp. TaxID=1686315 RepID=UPI0025F615C7|nr:hypothetical protein [uncultured Fenollaria sp.]
MIAIVDKAYYDILRDNLSEFNIKAFPSYESKILKGAVATHPDMSLFKYDEEILIASRESFEYYSEIFKATKIKIINANEDPFENYPGDVKFNALRVGEHLICKKDACADEIMNRFDGGKTINSSQGYVKCSVIDIGSEYFVTDDKYLQKIINGLGHKSILLEKGLVKIKDYDYGFIGGASGYASDKIFLTGLIKDEANRNRLEEFAREINKELIYLTEYDIFDVGTLMIMED